MLFPILIVSEKSSTAKQLVADLKSYIPSPFFFAKNLETFKKALSNHNPKLIILDFDLKEGELGLTIANFLQKECMLPFFIITNTLDTYTMNRLRELKPDAFLMRPFQPKQLFANIEILKHKLIQRQTQIETPNKKAPIKPSIKENYLLINQKDKTIKVPYAKIAYIQSDGNYVDVYTHKVKYVLRNTISQLSHDLPQEHFVKCHKKYIVNLHFLEAYNRNCLQIVGILLPIGRSAKNTVFKKIAELTKA